MSTLQGGSVAILDIMGFSQRMRQRSPQAIYEEVRWLAELAESAASEANVRARTYDRWNAEEDYHERAADLGTMFFADTLVIYETNPEAWACHFAAYGMTSVVSNLLEAASARGLLLRGAIAHGTYVVDAPNSIIVGRCLAEAHELEQQQCWAGVSIVADHPDFKPPRETGEEFETYYDKHAPQFPFSCPDPRVVAYDVPMSDGSRQLLWAVDWEPRELEKAANDLLAVPHVARKVEETRAFAQCVVKRKQARVRS